MNKRESWGGGVLLLLSFECIFIFFILSYRYISKTELFNCKGGGNKREVFCIVGHTSEGFFD